MQCLLTPGHTVGSTCFLVEDSLFSGDTVFIEGCGICTGLGGSVTSMYRSIQRLKSKHLFKKLNRGREGIRMIAFVFPGQGIQKKGMGKELFDKYPDYLSIADRVLGYSIKNLCLENTDNRLNFN